MGQEHGSPQVSTYGFEIGCPIFQQNLAKNLTHDRVFHKLAYQQAGHKLKSQRGSWHSKMRGYLQGTLVRPYQPSLSAAAHESAETWSISGTVKCRVSPAINGVRSGMAHGKSYWWWCNCKLQMLVYPTTCRIDTSSTWFILFHYDSFFTMFCHFVLRSNVLTRCLLCLSKPWPVNGTTVDHVPYASTANLSCKKVGVAGSWLDCWHHVSVPKKEERNLKRWQGTRNKAETVFQTLRHS